jgi:phage shock protein PspC (stress-responsive transcriptional regulator)
MQSITLRGISYDLPANSYEFLENYLSRINAYIKRHALDHSLYEDIEERIGERFSSTIEGGSALSSKDIVKIINEIGEPDAIFREAHWDDSHKSPSFQTILQWKLYRNTEEWVIFGVCAGLGDYFEINLVWFRILFISSLFFFGTGILVYLILAIIMPKKDSSPSLKSTTPRD